jgi:acetolactate synthase-1/3 small subunit
MAVHSVKLLESDHSIRRELVLIKISTETSEVCNRVIQIANIFRASVIDVSSTTITLALIGEESKSDAIVDLVSEFGILELVRTGMVAIERGIRTIYDQTKERGEFDYGKNVL